MTVCSWTALYQSEPYQELKQHLGPDARRAPPPQLCLNEEYRLPRPVSILGKVVAQCTTCVITGKTIVQRSGGAVRQMVKKEPDVYCNFSCCCYSHFVVLLLHILTATADVGCSCAFVFWLLCWLYFSH